MGNNKVSYKEMMDGIWEELREISKMDFPKYKNGIETKEYVRQRFLIAKFNELRDYERGIDSSYRHNNILVSARLIGATSIQNRINNAVAYN